MFLYANDFISEIQSYIFICRSDNVSKQLSAARMRLHINLFVLFPKDQLFAVSVYYIPL